ncbi:B-cell receptor CD22-like [Thalassophryne amazonica]|uniref:B-cell receptor CD22-like n=1 Tax=Thalassophryne amazonica TaxID=390379 RepID=UPI001472056D|nr:B-cell receptor CD22-like [Thalassophryne amazonica]
MRHIMCVVSGLILKMESAILVVLVILQGVFGGDWGVTFNNPCAVKGSTTIITCSYDYPIINFVTSVAWYKAVSASGKWTLVSVYDLTSDPNHFEYVGNFRHDCSLKINNAQSRDSGLYTFSFTTTLNRWRSKTYAYLNIKEMTATVQPETADEGNQVILSCLLGCPSPPAFVWFRDGQPVQNRVFQAKIEDAGSYSCAIREQQEVRSASVALNVRYAPKNVTLSTNPSGVVLKGSLVTFTCKSDANPPVRPGAYRLFKDRDFISSGENYTISDVWPGHSGRYHCQAQNGITWGGVRIANSTEVDLDVQYAPENISVSVNPPNVVEGIGVNLTCSSAANPAADSYTWYRRMADPSPTSMLQVGSGPVLSLPSMESSHVGTYLCRARNHWGENNSTEVPLIMQTSHVGMPLSILGGVVVALFLVLLVAVLWFWKNRKSHADKKQEAQNGTESKSLASEAPSEPVYANIQKPPSLPLAVFEEVIYSTVSIKPRNASVSRHSRTVQGSRENPADDDVIYATVVKSS